MAHDDPYAGKTLKADTIHDLSRAQSYTPELTASTTDPDLGEDGVAEGWWHLNGHLIIGGARFLFSGTGLDEGDGTYEISLPKDADSSLLTASGAYGSGSRVGGGFIRDDSVASNRLLIELMLGGGSGTVRMLLPESDQVASDTPATWAEGDRISVQFIYPADPDEL